MSFAERATYRIFISSALLWRLAWAYLLLPAVFFALGWLRPTIGLSLTLLLLGSMVALWRDAPKSGLETNLGDAVAGILLLGLWVLLSGIGGYAFQNWDHHWRNAIFHDLIHYSWPVNYNPAKSGAQMLVYYIGYWLPAAWVGKLVGWKAANAALFFWTWLGVFLIGTLLSLRWRRPLWKIALYVIFFSGMDALGVLLISKEAYPSLWPPIQHLEIWAGDLQYSSFTTALFWVFNQAVPAWLCLTLLLTHAETTHLFLLWALTLFFAPFPAIGLLPFLPLEIWEQVRRDGRFLPRRLFSFTTLPNLSGIGLAFVALLYFSANTAAQNRVVQVIPPLILLPFFFLEGGAMWMILGWSHRHDPRWYLMGLLLLIFPFFQVGNGRDFVMRASIPALFYLMLWTGDALASISLPRFLRISLIVLLLVGALTPLYEINRSLYRTLSFYFSSPQQTRIESTPVDKLVLDVPPEADHPGTLTADRLRSLANVRGKLANNFIADARNSFFYRFLARH